MNISKEELDKLADAYKEKMKKFGWAFNLDEQELIKQTFKAGFHEALEYLNKQNHVVVEYVHLT